MRVLMFGWEFPPFRSGGLGTACYGLTKGLSKNNVDVIFVLPKLPGSAKADYVKLISAADMSKIKIKSVDSVLVPYISSESYEEMLRYKKKSSVMDAYGSNLFEEVYRFSKKAELIAQQEQFDVIHCHDWMTYKAGINAKNVSHKPLIVHVHATEFDRTGGNPNPLIYNIEKEGMHKADLIIAVSNYTKNKIIEHYGVAPEKVIVVHNAVEFNGYKNDETFKIKEKDKIVLFLGRITLQKGPDYFLYAAKRVLEQEPNVKFIMVGSGDMEPFIIEKAAELGISDKVLFAGFLKGDDIDKAYQMADLYVMPSISEPFGITPLEAMRNGVPVLISKQSGVSEVISHCLKVDFWDIDEMTNKILAVLRYGPLHECLKKDGLWEVKKLSWNEPARKCIDVYNKALAMA